MISRYRVSLDGVQMDSLDENLLILDVNYSKVNKSVQQFSTANLDGYDIHDIDYDRQAVTVTFELRIYDIAQRNAIVQKINKWASSEHVLRTNDRKNQSLTVVCEEEAVIGSVKNWLDPMTIVFVSKQNPFWVSDTAKTVTMSGKNAKSTLKMDGNIKSSLISVNITTVDAVTSLKLTVGDTNLEFKKLSVAKNKSIVIDYVNNRYLRVRADGKSVLNKLHGTSTDNLMAECGVSTSVSLISDGKVTAVFSGKGLWL